MSDNDPMFPIALRWLGEASIDAGRNDTDRMMLSKLGFEIARLTSALAAANERNTGPGTPHARLQWIGEEAARRGIGKPFDSSRTPEQDVFEALDLARAEIAPSRILLHRDGGFMHNALEFDRLFHAQQAYVAARLANPLPENHHA